VGHKLGRAKRKLLPLSIIARNYSLLKRGFPMTHAVHFRSFRMGFAVSVVACLIVLFHPISTNAQLISFSKQELIDYTAANPFDRLPDGRPKVPDELIERARGLSSEDIWATLQQKSFNNQYADGFIILHPGKTMAGRVFTVQFMPVREDVEDIAVKKAKDRGIPRLMNQTAIDMLQPGDVLVVDMFGKKVNGTIVGDNLFFYIMKATHGGGLVVDGSIRDLEGLSEIDLPAYFRAADPTPIGNVMLTGINVPVRIGGVTVMPGDLAVGDREGVYFIPPQFVKEVLDRADEIHIHDEWTKKKFAEGKYKSSEIYGTPSDPKLLQEYKDFLKKRLDEIRKQRESKP
jgi:4-hydroxy-4-methyl-2-oxoglutarate aldolase